MLTLPVRPDYSDSTPTASGSEEAQRVLREFFRSLLFGQYQKRMDALESIAAFDALLMGFVKLNMLCIVSDVPDIFFRERLSGLDGMGKLVLCPPSGLLHRLGTRVLC